MKKKILIVEDNTDLIVILQRLLDLTDYETIVATDGKEAVAMAEDLLPDLIMMDIMLPEMDGLEATRLIRQNPKTQTIPIVAVTARIFPNVKEQCLQSGCNDYVTKSLLSKQLIPCIEKLLETAHNGRDKSGDRPS